MEKLEEIGEGGRLEGFKGKGGDWRRDGKGIGEGRSIKGREEIGDATGRGLEKGGV